VAAFDQVVEAIPQGAVIEVRGPVVARGSVFGALVGAWLRFGVGVVPGLGGAPPGAAWSALLAPLPELSRGGFFLSDYQGSVRLV
jgi:hypothetical protein